MIVLERVGSRALYVLEGAAGVGWDAMVLCRDKPGE